MNTVKHSRTAAAPSQFGADLVPFGRDPFRRPLAGADSRGLAAGAIAPLSTQARALRAVPRRPAFGGTDFGFEQAAARPVEDDVFADQERGGVTAEYAIAILTAAGFAGLLLAILSSDAVRGWLLDIVQRALN
ncbi:MAG: DUF4244 domain-containing protein [Bifidobacteriaceae bacterium]|jgi:hypothetical protein|nr:DUF4244 domain-containing protein [Bifidobacteriaceae bacterium]